MHVFANAHGRFGWDPTNPVPCGSIFSKVGADKYLTWLRWKGAEVVAQRLGSVGVDGMPGMIDRYSLSVDEKNVGTIFLCAYAKNNSFRLPKGFSPSKTYLIDSEIATTLNGTGESGDYLKRLFFNLVDVVRKERANEVDVDWTLFPLLLAYFDTTLSQHGSVEKCCSRLYPQQFSDAELMQFSNIAAIPPEQLKHPAAP